MTAAVSLEEVEVTYPGDRRVLAGVTLHIPAGAQVAVLGRNGAGKTTLLRLAAGQLWPGQGTVRVLGHCTKNQRALVLRNIGVSLYPERSFYYRLTASQNLRYFMSLHGMTGRHATDQRRELLALMELTGQADLPFMAMSLGQRKRLGIARALAGNPPVLLLDEPFANLDQPGRDVVARVIYERHEAGLTTMFTTHELADVQNAVTDVATVDAGLVRLRPVARTKTGPTRIVRIAGGRRRDVDLSLAAARWSLEIDEDGIELKVPVETPLAEVIDVLARAGVAVTRVHDDPWVEALP